MAKTKLRANRVARVYESSFPEIPRSPLFAFATLLRTPTLAIPQAAYAIGPATGHERLTIPMGTRGWRRPAGI